MLGPVADDTTQYRIVQDLVLLITNLLYVKVIYD